MKKFLMFAFILLAAIYSAGFYSLGDSGVNGFLDKMQAMTKQGDAQGLCDLLTDDMTVAITDHTAEADPRLGNGKLDGGKSELCAHLQSTVSAMSVPGLTVHIQRNGMQVNRQSLLHPWMADVTYNEKQAIDIKAGNKTMTIKTESDDKLHLVLTLTGVKIKRLESEAWLQ